MASNEGILTCQSPILTLLCLRANISHSQVTLGFNEPYLKQLASIKIPVIISAVPLR